MLGVAGSPPPRVLPSLHPPHLPRVVRCGRPLSGSSPSTGEATSSQQPSCTSGRSYGSSVISKALPPWLGGPSENKELITWGEEYWKLVALRDAYSLYGERGLLYGTAATLLARFFPGPLATGIKDVPLLNVNKDAVDASTVPSVVAIAACVYVVVQVVQYDQTAGRVKQWYNQGVKRFGRAAVTAYLKPAED